MFVIYTRREINELKMKIKTKFLKTKDFHFQFQENGTCLARVK